MRERDKETGVRRNMGSGSKVKKGVVGRIEEIQRESSRWRVSTWGRRV